MEVLVKSIAPGKASKNGGKTAKSTEKAKAEKEKAAKKKEKEPKEFKGIFGGEDDDDSSDSEMVREMMETMHPACNRIENLP